MAPRAGAPAPGVSGSVRRCPRRPETTPWRRWGLPPPKSEASRGDLSLVDYEVYSGIEVRDWPCFVRLDGWAFHALAIRLGLASPFDRQLPEALVRAASALFAAFSPTLCYVFSAELDFLFLAPAVFRRVEKIDSVFAGLLSAHFSALVGTPAAFDCRVIPVGRERIRPYLVWRQAECWRNHNNAWAQWALVEKAGLSPRRANRRLAGLKAPDLAALCQAYGIDLARTPAWQRRGVLLYVETYRRPGYDPVARARVTVERRRVRMDWAIGRFDTADGEAFLRGLLQPPGGARGADPRRAPRARRTRGSRG